MKTLVHLSDLHFGRTDPALVEPLLAQIHELRPDLVAISGDLSQRARTSQFRHAREFLDRIPAPCLVVPGNHDVPLHNVFARFLTPFAKYRRYISRNLEPVYGDDELVAVGINTARSLTIQGGSIASAQVQRVAEHLCAIPDGVIKVIVAHHPFDLPAAISIRHLVHHAQKTLAYLVECGADLFLAGHLHVCHIELTTRRYHIPGRSAVVIQAGTGLSTRTRGENNNFNVIRTSATGISVETYAWSADIQDFLRWRCERFSRKTAGWERQPVGG